MANLTGTRIDKYEMLEEVGRGGMAVVYRGRDSVLDREVAVKVLHPHLADREESRLRLQREAIAVAKLRHDNILEIFDYSGPDAEESYIVTEFIHGPTLREWIEEHPAPRPVVAAMVVHRLCTALWHAHKGSIVHRDIKPENVMIRMEDGNIKLMDFGIAQIIDNKKLTLTGQLIGSPAYMAPELISGRPLDARTDLFSVGILLYQLATAELPFNGRNPHEVLTRIADGDYPAPSTICPLVDRDLEAIIDRALALNPDDRYQSVETFAKELAEYLGEMGLEPSTTELGAYFKNPDAYVVELDARVCAALVDAADKAGAAGSTARAIRLLGRVVEIEPTHEGATTLLARFKARERRSRQFLLAAGSLALGGLIAAGYVLIPSQTAEGTSKPPMLAMAGADEDTPVPPPAGDETGAAPASSDSDAPPNDDASVGPAPAETGVDEPPPTTADGGPKPRADVTTRTFKRPRTPKTPVPSECEVTLSGVPASQLASLNVTAAGKKVTVKGDKAQLSVPDEGLVVSVDHKRYSARRKIFPNQCPAELPIFPKPAAVVFRGIPRDTSVRCESGCGPQLSKQNQMARSFRKVPLDDGKSRVLTLVFQHDEFQNLKMSHTVYPGPNVVEVKLQPRGN